jgi:hypothetical protein
MWKICQSLGDDDLFNLSVAYPGQWTAEFADRVAYREVAPTCPGWRFCDPAYVGRLWFSSCLDTFQVLHNICTQARGGAHATTPIVIYEEKYQCLHRFMEALHRMAAWEVFVEADGDPTPGPRQGRDFVEGATAYVDMECLGREVLGCIPLTGGAFCDAFKFVNRFCRMTLGSLLRKQVPIYVKMRLASPAKGDSWRSEKDLAPGDILWDSVQCNFVELLWYDAPPGRVRKLCGRPSPLRRRMGMVRVTDLELVMSSSGGRLDAETMLRTAFPHVQVLRLKGSMSLCVAPPTLRRVVLGERETRRSKYWPVVSVAAREQLVGRACVRGTRDGVVLSLWLAKNQCDVFVE